jgi:hypothetical protein
LQTPKPEIRITQKDSNASFNNELINQINKIIRRDIHQNCAIIQF